MTKRYIAGYYWIKCQGRGVIRPKLTASQAKALFELHLKGELEIEGIELDETGGQYTNLTN